MSYWRIMWNGNLYFRRGVDAIQFINGHPGCSAQFVEIKWISTLEQAKAAR